MSQNKHIAIVGGGLVGSLLSIYLIRRGYRVTVFERRGDMRRSGAEGGRSINLALSTRGIRALEEIGLSDLVKKVAIPMHGRMMHDLKGNLSFLPYGKEGQFINSVSRSGLNVALMDEAERRNVVFRFNQRCVAIDFEKTELTVESDNSRQTQKFDLIIGADGAFSAVRSAMQITDRFNYSQHYIEHGYKELMIPSLPDGKFPIEKNALHIWPRESFMMIALPNLDGTFTCTLFFPFEGKESFSTLNTDDTIRDFFKRTFPDAVQMMPTLHEDFHDNPTSSLVTIRCFPWRRHNTMLIGDAAHAIVPFFGQGMNAGFEDCRILNAMLDQHSDNWETVLDRFPENRKPDTDAIATLAFDNFIEMRDLVGDPDFLLRKKIEARLHTRYPDRWIPLYSMVTFHDGIRYSEALATGQRQKKIMDEVMSRPGIQENWQTLDLDAIVSKLN